jgi:hypothetical protein
VVPLKFTKVVKVCADEATVAAAQNRKTAQAFFQPLKFIPVISLIEFFSQRTFLWQDTYFSDG